MQNKKQAFELFESICNINDKVWNNHAGSYDDAKEAAYQIEEALEGLVDSDFDVDNFKSNDLNSCFGGLGPKAISRYITNQISNSSMKDVDRFDKALKAISSAISSMHKLGLSSHSITEGLQSLVDSYTKEDVRHQSKLQQILDKSKT